MTLGAAGTNKCDWDKSTGVKVFQSQELTDLTSQRPGGGEGGSGGGSHTPTLGVDGKRPLKSAANWFSVENATNGLLPANVLCKRRKTMLHCESWSYCWATAHSCVTANVSHVRVMSMMWINGFFQDFQEVWCSWKELHDRTGHAVRNHRDTKRSLSGLLLAVPDPCPHWICVVWEECRCEEAEATFGFPT